MKNPNQNEPTAEAKTEWRKTADDWTTRAQGFLRDDPNKAVGFAVLAGVVLTVLPVGRLLAMVIRLALALVRPALLILGGVKAYEEFEKRGRQ